MNSIFCRLTNIFEFSFLSTFVDRGGPNRIIRLTRAAGYDPALDPEGTPYVLYSIILSNFIFIRETNPDYNDQAIAHERWYGCTQNFQNLFHLLNKTPLFHFCMSEGI